MHGICPNYTPAKDSPDWQTDIRTLFGRPYAFGGRYLSGFDCWGLVWYIYNHIFKIRLPDHPSIEDRAEKVRELQRHIDSGQWEKLDGPEHGAVVAMSRSRRITHVGVWVELDDGICLHVQHGQYVVGHTIQQLKGQGISNIQFFRFNG